jgi:hypothetical protein
MNRMQEVPSPRLIVPISRPLIGVPVDADGEEAVQYFTDETAADELARPPIKLAGAWADLDDEDVLDAIDRLRHASPPTPPICGRMAPLSRRDAAR